MNKRKPVNPRQLAREKLLFRYSSALERGDFETVSAVLREAENDPVLERMLLEVNAVYSAELLRPTSLPSLSTNHNHNHRTGGERHTMNMTYSAIGGQLRPVAPPRNRWNFAVTLAAAVAALVFFAAILIGRPPGDSQQDNPALALQEETETPLPSHTPTATPFPTYTPAPSSGQGSTSPTATPVPADRGTMDTGEIIIVGTALPPTVVAPAAGCQGITLTSANLFEAPTLSSRAIAYLPEQTALQIITQQYAADAAIPGVWLLVEAQSGGIVVEGWIHAPQVTLTSPCPSGDTSTSGIPCPAGTPLAVTPTSTPVDPVAVPDADTEIVIDPTATPMTTPLPPTVVPPCAPFPALTPTAGIPYTAWDNITTREAVGDIPPNTPIRITAAYYDGKQWLYAIETLDRAIRLYAPESALILPYQPDATPTAAFAGNIGVDAYDLLTTESLGTIQANTRVRILSGYYDGRGWVYEVMATDGQTATAREYQLAYEYGVPSGTPTAVFGDALGMGFYAAITTEPIGNIPAGTRVQLSTAQYNGVEWLYQITDEAGRAGLARESQLELAPDYTPGMPTPTAAYFNLAGRVLFTRVQIGDIPPNTPVQATSGYYDGSEWVYGITTLDNALGGEARASELRAVPLSDLGTAWPPQPVLPSLTPAPTATPVS